MTRITAKFPGTCRKCGRKIQVGDQIEWEKGKGSQHVACKDAAEPILNSPPAQQSVSADTDLAAAAKQYGRVAVADAGLATFSRQVHKGEHCLANGSVEYVKGKRYVVLGHSKPRYFSRDDLDDFDMFGRDPGLWYDWQGVQVEATEEERAADRAKADAKAHKEAVAKRRGEIKSMVRKIENAIQPEQLPKGLEDVWGRRGMAGHSVVLSDGQRYVACTESSYDDGYYAWMVEDAALAKEAVELKEAVRQ